VICVNQECNQGEVYVPKTQGAQEQKVAAPRIDPLILKVRGQKVIIDEDLARIYGVETRRLNEQVKRNVDRFPEDFVFRLTKEAYERLLQSTDLKSQIAISSYGIRIKSSKGVEIQ